jgi:Skp family chaperone for outer membrane proteins
MPVIPSVSPSIALRHALAGAASLVLLLAAPGLAGDKPAAQSKRQTSPIALIDLKYVFDHDPGFQQAKSELDTKVKLAEAMAVMRKASIDKLTSDREKQKHDSAEYRALDQLLSQETAELRIQVQLWQKQFVRQEAELYHTTYEQIQSLVDAYVEEQGITVVLRFNRAEVEDSGDAKQIAVLLNRPIVAYQKPADISDEILHRLEKQAAASVARRPKESADGKR